ncbi:MAG TPA: methyl-accepting chemotaxis protein [Desulfotomaculum sp.]|nr:MAG: chemotaxis protein [Peptococcaceae bacterium BRH_c8a]KJS77210.1 MAG: chemotaxis protein [Desulfotomaculum sp. BICA1-6]HBX22915.1 methyl-accepting chemotaxis protein [Desulfotomaculum sp.]
MKLKLGAKISFSFVIMLIIVIILGGSAFVNLNSVKGDIDSISAANESLILELRIDSTFQSGVAAMRGFIAYGDEKFYEQTDENMNAVIRMESKLLQMAGEDKKPAVQSLIIATTQYRDGLIGRLAPVVRAYHSELNAGNAEKAQIFFAEMNSIAGELIPYTAELTGITQKLVEENEQIVNQSLNQTTSHADSVISTSVVMLIIALIIGVILSVYMTRMLRNPILKMVSGANKYAEGDLREVMEINSTDELSELADALNKMQTGFKDIVGKIKDSSNQLSDSAQQLAAQAQQTSAGATETASTMSEMSSTVENMADNTQDVARQAGVATQHADKGFQGIEMVTDQMQEITASSIQVGKSVDALSTAIGKISQFVEVITNIADQTNLLALNAAIEAARAGDAGRGFAVVAEEVRELAEQSAQSTKEIKQLIEEIQAQSEQAVQAMSVGAKKVDQGNRVVGEVGESFNEIIKAVRELTDQVQNVAAAAQQVSAGVQNVAGTTEEQTAAMEEVSASTEELNKLAMDLNSVVLRFKV